MRLVMTLLLVTASLLPARGWSYDIGLVPVHEYDQQAGRTWGLNISLHASRPQVEKMRRWLEQI